MTLTELQSLIGSLTNDPNHDRYSLYDINTELDNSQRTWNIEAKIIKSTVLQSVVDGDRDYSLSTIFGARSPISFVRVTHNGIDLLKRSKQYFDHLSARDWTLDTGTPKEYYVEATDTVNNLLLVVHPTPTAADVGIQNLVIEAIVDHDPMVDSTDVPFTKDDLPNFILRPYDWGLAYSVASKLLLRDPSNENALKSTSYGTIARNVLTEVIQVFKSLEAEEPKRLSGGRYWNSGNPRMVK